MNEFPEAVRQLLELGSEAWEDESTDYRAMGIGPEHIPDLIRMLEDPTLLKAVHEEDAAWAPIHALQALTELGAEEAAEPLIRLMQDEDIDWVREDAPAYFSAIGPRALPLLAAALRDPSRDLYTRWTMGDCIAAIGWEFPEHRAECMGLLTEQLEKGTTNDPTLNGAIISSLLDMEAEEAAPIIERAFADNAVDESIAGGWEEVRFELGLGPPPPPRRFEFLAPPPLGRPPKTKAQKQGRKRNKLAKQSRKRNRKKKKK